MKRAVLIGVLGSALLSSVLILSGLYVLVRGSLPPLDGERAVSGIGAPVDIEHDARGVPTLIATSRPDLAFATGFVHGQDRYFQMDLMRRRAAGELAELFGPRAVPVDRDARVHRFRMRARRVLETADAGGKALIDAYASGVNAGLGSLDVRPFEYLLLRTAPRAWRAEDSVLVIYAMWLTLNDSTLRGELERGQLADVLPPGLTAFIDPPGTRWDAAIDGSEQPVPPMPGADIYDLRKLDRALFAARPGPARIAAAAGSNNWAVAGSRTADGHALLASDMHLALEVPNIWYRARLVLGEQAAPDGGFDLNGLTLPGGPFIVAGSNGHIAWSFTNSYGDWADLVRLGVDSQGRYVTPGRARPFRSVIETIRARDAADVGLEVRSTVWGPVSATDAHGRPLALRWLAHDPTATNLAFADLEHARDVPAAIEIASRIGAPPQNFLVADRDGRIGWTIMGRIPVRAAYDAHLPRTSVDGGAQWIGWLESADYPRHIDPPGGLLWSANARVVGGEALRKIGVRGFAFGARAQQIRDDLAERNELSVADMLDIQLDDTARYLGGWSAILSDLLSEEHLRGHPRRRELLELLEGWPGRAATESAAYRLVRHWHDRLLDAAYQAITAEVRARSSGARLRPPHQFAGSLWRLVEEQPLHLLDPRYPSWEAFMLAQVDAVLAELEPGPLRERSWGEVNTVRIQHPMSRALPALGRWLDMPPATLPGDDDLPRVQRPGFGASARFAVSPGREEQGYLHMPAGQSGHPLSPYYRAGHEAWARGEPLPFLPGEARHHTRLLPAP